MKYTERVLIFGGTGQDGALLAESILKHCSTDNVLVVSTTTSNVRSNLWRLEHLGITERVKIYRFDMTEDDPVEIIREVSPTKIYILAGQTNTANSISAITMTAQINVYGFSRILEAIKEWSPEAAVFIAGSSEMFGNGPNSKELVSLEENCKCEPRNPYGITKLYQYHLIRQYREFYKLRITAGILFNHESEFRGRQFVSKKITRNIAKYKLDNSHTFSLGNMSSMRDWSCARDFVRGFQDVINKSGSGDYIFASGILHSVRDFVSKTCEAADLQVSIEGEGMEEKVIDIKNGNIIADVSPRYFRTNDTHALRGDSSKLRERFGWEPTRKLSNLVCRMFE